MLAQLVILKLSQIRTLIIHHKVSMCFNCVSDMVIDRGCLDYYVGVAEALAQAL